MSLEGSSSGGPQEQDLSADIQEPSRQSDSVDRDLILDHVVNSTATLLKRHSLSSADLGYGTTLELAHLLAVSFRRVLHRCLDTTPISAINKILRDTIEEMVNVRERIKVILGVLKADTGRNSSSVDFRVDGAYLNGVRNDEVRAVLRVIRKQIFDDPLNSENPVVHGDWTQLDGIVAQLHRAA